MDNNIIKNVIDNYLSTRDQKFFNLLYKKHERYVRSVVRSYVQNPEDIKDLEQDVWLKVYMNLHHYRGESSFKTWLYSIACNICLSFKSNQVSTEDFDSIPEDEHEPDPNTPPELLEAKEVMGSISQMLDALHERDFEIFWRAVDSNEPYAVVAKDMGISAGNVAVIVHRVKEQIREIVKANAAS